MLGSKFKKILQKGRKAKTQIVYLPQAFKLVQTAARHLTWIWISLLIILGFLPLALVYLSAQTINSLAAGLSGEHDLSRLISTSVLLFSTFGVLLLMDACNNLNVWVRTVQAELTQDYISSLIHKQAVELDLAFFETPDYYDFLHRAAIDAKTQPIALLENMGELVRNSITFLSMVAVLLSFGPLLPLGLLAATFPPLFVLSRFNQIENTWRLHNTAAQRQIQYYGTLLTSRESAAEIRLFALGAHFQSAYQQNRDRLRRERSRLIRNRGLAQFAASLSSLSISGAALGWIIWQIGQGTLSLGHLTLLAQAIFLGQGVLRSLLAALSKVFSNILSLKDLFGFLALKPQIVNPPQPVPAPMLLRHGIEMQQVTFRYPGSQQVAIDRFTLKIPAGKMVAIVGENGAGKSTLIKLLCRFYDPEAGRILLDGTDLRDLSLEHLRQSITVLFQFPVHYCSTAAENISLSALAASPTIAAIEAAAQAAGANIPINRLPQGYQTLLGKWFGGEELSGGEWQRVALARAFLRQAPIVILDEPTSAMDSWAEADWMVRFRKLVAGKTAIVITHRFTTAMQADLIYVMMQGQIVESGTHTDLLALGGRYAESWQTQMQCADRFK